MAADAVGAIKRAFGAAVSTVKEEVVKNVLPRRLQKELLLKT